jgi:hypothetical protein
MRGTGKEVISMAYVKSKRVRDVVRIVGLSWPASFKLMENTVLTHDQSIITLKAAKAPGAKGLQPDPSI